jgi:hypothetical protein
MERSSAGWIEVMQKRGSRTATLGAPRPVAAREVAVPADGAEPLESARTAVPEPLPEESGE